MNLYDTCCRSVRGHYGGCETQTYARPADVTQECSYHFQAAVITAFHPPSIHGRVLRATMVDPRECKEEEQKTVSRWRVSGHCLPHPQCDQRPPSGKDRCCYLVPPPPSVCTSPLKYVCSVSLVVCGEAAVADWLKGS